jgi:hypothetical protein
MYERQGRMRCGGFQTLWTIRVSNKRFLGYIPSADQDSGILHQFTPKRRNLDSSVDRIRGKIIIREKGHGMADGWKMNKIYLLKRRHPFFLPSASVFSGCSWYWDGGCLAGRYSSFVEEW